MFDLKETPEEPTFDPFYTHTDGTHWVHSSLYINNPKVDCWFTPVDCWFTPDALVMWHPEVFEYDHTTPVSPLLKFPTFAPKNSEYTLVLCTWESWVAGPLDPYLEDTYGYVFVNNWGTPSDCIGRYKRLLAAKLREHNFEV